MEKIEKPRCVDCFYFDATAVTVELDGRCLFARGGYEVTEKFYCGDWRDKNPPHETLEQLFNTIQLRACVECEPVQDILKRYEESE